MTRELHWSWEGQTIPLGLDEAGEGPSALLLPALSSISTRGEMQPLLERLQHGHRVVTVDWPGFGDRPRPKLDYSPAMLQAFLDWLLTEIVPRPALLVTAGHASAYALDHLARHPGTVGRLVLVAPTWRGPFPTMMGGERPWFARIRAAVDAPVLGPALYALNLSGPVIRKMVVGHVYSDRAWLTPERMAAKRAVTSAAGAVASRDAFLALAEKAAVPTLVVYGAETPPKSRAEMEALAARPGIESVRLPQGKLSLHEEFPDAVAEAIARFAPG